MEIDFVGHDNVSDHALSLLKTEKEPPVKIKLQCVKLVK